MNLLEPGLAFIEGVALIASPCILPVLPLILSASVEGGKRRPFGIITGFVLAFSVFALTSRWVVTRLGFDLDYIKYGSLILLGLFGVVLISKTLSEKFSLLTQGAANFGGNVARHNKGGFSSGVVVGALIGLVWTPCAGPILAVVLVQVIRQQSDLFSLLIIASFALGAGIPMLVISLTGRTLMNKMSFIKTHTESIRRAFGVVIVLAVAFIASGIDAQSFFATSKETTVNQQQGLIKALDKPYLAPDFVNIEQWLNSRPLTMGALKGKVVLVDFWTYSCINCVRTLPYITSWDEKYRDKGLVIIGLHSPEFEFEKKIGNVKSALTQHHIRYPVALDNQLATWSNFKNQYWPAHYLIDKEGRVVYTHFGEGDYDVTEHNIRVLLGVMTHDVLIPREKTTALTDRTPETYMGYARAERFAGKDGLIKDEIADYDFPLSLPTNNWALQGSWHVEKQKITATIPNASLRLNFTAKKVFLVLGTMTGKTLHAKLLLNGAVINKNAGKNAPLGNLTVNHNTLYELINQDDAKKGLLEIKALEPGLEIYAFTFG